MLHDYLFNGSGLIPEIIVGPVIIYILVLAYTRIFGLKSFSQMTGFDFAMTIAVGSLIASTAVNGAPSILVGIVLIGSLFLLNYLVSAFRYQSQEISKIIDNTPVMLMWQGEVLHENLDQTKVTEEELIAKLREANVLSKSQIKAVILETTGDVSVLHSEQEQLIDDYILRGVKN